MTRLVPLLLLLALPAGAAAQQKVVRGFRVDPSASIRIQVPAGRLVLRAWDRDSVAVTGTIAPRGGSFYGGGAGAAAKLGIETDPGGAGPGSDLEVQVPRRARLWIKTSTASVEITGTEGELDVLSVTGAITVDGNPRVASLESVDGRIGVTAVAPVLRVRTSGGAVVIATRGGDLTAATVGGSVDVSCPALERGRFETVSGAVSFAGAVASGGVLEAETHGADIALRFAGDLNAGFRLSAPGGAVVNQLDPKAKPVSGKALEFVVGTPAAEVRARTFKGTIRLGR